MRTPIVEEAKKAAAASVWRVRVAEFTRWMAEGPAGGRKLTQTGRLTMADARHLVARLGTGDVIDPVIGDRTFRTKSSEELTGLQIALERARTAGLVRRRGNALVAVKKHAGLVDRPAELLARMVNGARRPRAGGVPLGVGQVDPLRRLPHWRSAAADRDGSPPGRRGRGSRHRPTVGQAVTALPDRRPHRALQLDGWRRCLTRDVWLTVELLAETGLLTVDLTQDREQRRAARVPVTALGRRVLRQARGGPGAGEPVLQLRIDW